jgi:steroid delta-isomerase-like uncharacterized protein
MASTPTRRIIMSATVESTNTAIDATLSFFEAYNNHQVERMVNLCSEGAQLRYVPMGERGQGKASQVGKAIWSGLIDAFPDLHVTVQSIFGDERNVAAEVMIGGTQRKDFLNIPSKGEHYELPHAFLLKVDERKMITEITAYWDNASFYSQLGKTTLN